MLIYRWRSAKLQRFAVTFTIVSIRVIHAIARIIKKKKKYDYHAATNDLDFSHNPGRNWEIAAATERDKEHVFIHVVRNFTIHLCNERIPDLMARCRVLSIKTPTEMINH